MTKESKIAKPGTGFTIDLPEGVKKSLPKDFDIGAIGNIDLVEAEAIANENVLLLNEKDLIEGLEDFDLIPLKESPRVSEEIAARETAAPAKTGTAVLAGPAEEEEEIAPAPEPVPEEATPPLTEGPVARRHEEEFDDGRAWVPLHEIDTIDEHGRKWVPIHKLGEEESPGEGATTGVVGTEEAAIVEAKEPVAAEPAVAGGDKVLSLDDLVEPEEVEVALEKGPAAPVERVIEVTLEEAAEPTVARVEATGAGLVKQEGLPGGHVDETEEYMIWDMPDSEAVIAEPVAKKEEFAAAVDRPAEEKEKPVAVAGEHAVTGAPMKEAGKEEKPEQPAPARAKDVPLAALRTIDKKFGDETAPPVADDMAGGQALFIDDKQAGGGTGVEGIFDENRLERIISGIVQVDEGASYLMREANADEDRERIATLSKEFRPEYDEIFEDLEYKYADEEMDYIHTAIVEEDYSSYIREIDEFFGTRGGRAVSARLELLGLTADEFDSIEDMLFKSEYKDVNLYDRYHLYEFERGSRGGDKEDRQYRYLLPAEGSLFDFERDSIESDVSAASALIFEEDVQQIKEQLMKRTGRTDVEAVDLVTRSFGKEEPAEEKAAEEIREEAAPEVRPFEEPVPAGPPPVEEPAPAATVAPAVDRYYDITDRVVILEDQADVERFVRTFPEPKQVNIKMLLKYLDGLFERLPEDIIRKFASSDYFNLYLKVLNELGV
jgi:hypothetical protein